MITLQERAFAKLNLTLDVLGKRQDGYHDICSVMQTIELCDEIEMKIGTKQPWRVVCNRAGIPEDAGNIAYQAAKLFFDAVKKDPDGLEIRIAKHIPHQAGMGGGSADAAAVLKALNRYYQMPFSLSALAELSVQIGSDVPYCVMGGTALVEGRGERVTPLHLPDGLKLCFVVCKPGISLSTGDVYGKLDAKPILLHPQTGRMQKALMDADLSAIGSSFLNVFEAVVLPTSPELQEVKKAISDCGALGVQMTGTGSAVFGLFASDEQARQACSVLRQTYANVYLANSC